MGIASGTIAIDSRSDASLASSFVCACDLSLNSIRKPMINTMMPPVANLSSIGGLRSFPALGYYNATKFAVEGLSEALWQEVEPLGIKVMLVEPSGFRTDWAGRSANETEHQIADYADTADKNIRQLRAISGNQDGDPVRAAEAIVKAVESSNPPHRLLLGNDAYDGAISKLDELRDEFAAWEDVSRGADFPEATPAVMA